MTKIELEQLLNYHDNLYYNKDAPEITDAEYDALKNEYVEKYGEYNYVPGKASDDKKKFEHVEGILSLDKVKISEEDKLVSNIERLWPIIIEPKFDGLTLVSYPNTSELLRCYDLIHVTRGNGHIGEIVTDKAKDIEGIGHLGELRTLPVRSEVLMCRSDFEKLNKERIEAGIKPFENTRNAAAGMLRNIDITKIKGLKVFSYDLIGSTATEEGKLEILKSLGWNTTNYYKPKNIEEALNYIKNFDRDALDYDIDGLVIKHNGNKKFGSTAHHPNNAIAVKFEPKGEWTTIKNIKWQVGRTGKITPVADIEPVNILGSTVKRATLHNYGIIKALGLNIIKYKGKYTPATKVFVIKSNDVIPAIIKVEQPETNENNIYEEKIFEPLSCPECNEKTTKENDQLFCTNFNCPAKILNRLIHLSQRDAFDIEDLGEETAKKMIDKYKEMMEATLNQIDMAIESGEHNEYLLCEYDEINHKLKHLHPSLIYDFTLKDIKSLPGFADKSAINLFNSIKQSLELPFDRFLYGTGIPNVGSKIAKNIAEFYYDNKNSEVYNFVMDYQNDFQQLSKCKDVGPVIIKSIRDNYITSIVPFGNYNFNIKDVIPKKKANNQLTFVITGEFEISREEIKKIIEDAGHKVTNSVSKKTSYLLAAHGEEGTTKYKKAKDLGTTIINSLKELEDILC